jgi:8-oxo-dGTP diphosphatase
MALASSTMDPEHDFSGSKLALFLRGEVLVYRRDDRLDIPFPGYWDLPGGGREGDESPLDCARRELNEEFGIGLDPVKIVWARAYPRYTGEASFDWFFAAPLSARHIGSIRFGHEGEFWRMMAIDEYLGSPLAIPHLRDRLRDYVEQA